MPKMIPETISSDTKSLAEKKLFNALEHLDGCDDWTVIHSLAIADHTTQSQGESDFLVIIPKKGIFVLEVKGGRKISCENGSWISEDRNGIEHAIKNPGIEANEGMHSIINYLKVNAPEISKVTTGFGVVFPDCSVHGTITGPDVSDKQICDASDMLDLRKYFNTLSNYWGEKDKKANPGIIPPEQAVCKRIIELLRPKLELKLSPRVEIRTLEDSIITLTERQQMVFEGLSENDRVLVRGNAGTGKTILAVNYALSAARNNKKTAFFCYNKKLGDFLKNSVSGYDNIACGSFTEYMDGIVHDSRPVEADTAKEQNREEYYDEILPELFTDCLLENGEEGFDCLIIDEAQDLLKDRYLDVMDYMLKGGLKGGNWYFFIDAENQNIYNPEETCNRVLERLGSMAGYTKYSLKENCRNSVAIIKKVEEIFGGQSVPGYKYRGEDFGPAVEIIRYRYNTEQAETLEKIITDHLNSGVRPGDITILSAKVFDKSVASMVKSVKIVPAKASKQKDISFSTISSYKGLENSMIIIVDFDKMKSDDKKLLYIGMTRARSKLIILCENKVYEYIEKHKGAL